MKLYETIVTDCDECLGHGYIFWGGREDYHVQQCECFDGSLFLDGENL